ncbi:MAG TPA: sigma-70 family RNA polymerase sigma factor [Thermoanaerobaculia bacterium]|jgi:RNA polymerase sigma-70 factor (ECF subfamily)|nr:sigma-70 family RNA polymerase sigma factor [Thermoanaerobaculia bacterium]
MAYSMPEALLDRTEAEIARDLVRQIQRGDTAAETKLVERYSRGLLYMLRRTAGDPALADDLHQETFRVVLERLRERGLEDPERLAGFLHRTAKNLFIGGYRKVVRRKTEGEMDGLEAVADPAADPHREAVREEEATLVRRLIGELETDRDRQILYRFYIAEEEKERICADLDLSSLHFNRVLFRARQRFKELLEGAGVR